MYNLLILIACTLIQFFCTFIKVIIVNQFSVIFLVGFSTVSYLSHI